MGDGIQMKVLHTADIHLRHYEDERWKTLCTLIDLGKEKKIEILVISGDLFDRNSNAEDLRPQIRELFSNNDFKIVLIPGNHDMDSYKGGMYFGEDTVILTDLGTAFEYKDVKIVGIPFEPVEGETTLRKLRLLVNNLTSDKKNILLYHGELLDAFFSRKDFGDEGEERYMPVRLSYFKDLHVDYILAGHFHSRFDVWRLDHGGYFVYPGSPISITKREVGRRKVNLFEVGKPPEGYPLDTHHFEEIEIEFDPFRDENPMEIIRGVFGSLHKDAKVILFVKGFINSKALRMSEKEVVETIEGIASEQCIEKHYEFRDIQIILEDELFKTFLRNLEKMDDDSEKKREMLNIVIRAMMKAQG